MNTPKAPSVWLNATQVRDLVLSARKAKASLIAIITGIEERVAARRDVLTKSLSDLDTKARLVAIDSAATKIKADEKIATNAQRTEILRSLARMNEQAKGAIPFYESSVQMLLRETIASSKRATIFQNLEAAGPVELKAFASLAIATADKGPWSAGSMRSSLRAPGRSAPAPWPTLWWASSSGRCTSRSSRSMDCSARPPWPIACSSRAAPAPRASALWKWHSSGVVRPRSVASGSRTTPMRAKHVERQQALRLERLRRAIGDRTSVTPREVFASLGFEPRFYCASSAEHICAALASIGYLPHGNYWSKQA